MKGLEGNRDMRKKSKVFRKAFLPEKQGGPGLCGAGLELEGGVNKEHSRVLRVAIPLVVCPSFGVFAITKL